MKTILVALILLSLCLFPAWSSDVLVAPSEEEIIEKLSPKSKTIRLRGITIENPEADTPPSINIRVQFEFNSAKLSLEALQTLDRLGRALSSQRLETFRFQVAGHTDAKGSDDYNQDLSLKRAQAVKGYIMRRHAVAAKRLVAQGFGEKRLLRTNAPFADENRRVQISNMGGLP